MVRDVEVVDAVVSGLSTLHYVVFRGTPNITEPTHRHKRSNALKLCTFFFLSLGRSWPSAAATAAPTNTMGTWQSQATHSTQHTQNTADITLHRLLALRHCKLLLRAATPCGLGPTGHMTPSRTHCSHIPSAQTQAGARAHVLLRRTLCCKRRPLPRQRFKHMIRKSLHLHIKLALLIFN